MDLLSLDVVRARSYKPPRVAPRPSAPRPPSLQSHILPPHTPVHAHSQEGHELETLLGIDLTRVHIDFILSENAHVKVLLRPLGYEPSRLKFGGGDVLWARPGHAAEMLQAAIARGIKLH